MARFPRAQWKGPVPNQSGATAGVRLFVVHIMDGTFAGTDAWFHNPKAHASSHLGTARDGRLAQWVDTSVKAWAQAAFNPVAVSIENEGHSGDQLTGPQLEQVAQAFAWAHLTHPGIALQRTVDPDGSGLIAHGELGTAGGGHFACPGDPIKRQFPAIVARAVQIVGGVKPMFDPPLSVAAWCLIPAGVAGNTVTFLAGVAPDGAVFCEPPDQHRGGANGHRYFAGHRAALIRPRPGAAGTLKDPPYEIQDTGGNWYGAGGFDQ